MIEKKHHWTEEDFELDHEFELIQFEVKRHLPKSPPVPNRLEKQVKRHASFKASEQLKKNVIFGPALQLALGALLLAAISLVFLQSLQHKAEYNNPAANSPDLQWQAPLDPNDKNFKNRDWYLVEFTVIPNGRATNILIIKSCIRDPSQACGWDMSYEKQVREQISKERYHKIGKQQQVIWLRDESKAPYLRLKQ